MDDNVTADFSLVQEGGICLTQNYRWFGDATGKFGIGFDIDNTNNDCANMRAIATRCKHKCYGNMTGRSLDGDAVTPNGDSPASPGSEDVQWSFSK